MSGLLNIMRRVFRPDNKLVDGIITNAHFANMCLGGNDMREISEVSRVE